MAFAAKDPVRQAYDLIVATLKAHAGLTGSTALVPVGIASIVDYTAAAPTDLRKSKVTQAEYPILDVLPGTEEDKFASDEYQIDAQFLIGLDTGKVNAGDLFWVRWQIRRALWTLRDTTATGLTWLREVRFGAAESDLEVPSDTVAGKRKRLGWIGLIGVLCPIVINQTDLT